MVKRKFCPCEPSETIETFGFPLTSYSTLYVASSPVKSVSYSASIPLTPTRESLL